MFGKPILKSHRWVAHVLAVLSLLLLALIPLPPRSVPAVLADTIRYGVIASDETWTPDGSPYVITDTVQIASGVVLTIQSGAIVKFNAGTSLRVDGTLVAQGATFTSNKSSPARDDWGNIFFSASSVDAVFDAGGDYVSGSIIQDCTVEYGGDNDSGAIRADTASPFVNANTIRNNGTSGLWIVGRSANQQTIISNNTISGNALNVWSDRFGGGIYAVRSRIISNTITANYANTWDGRSSGGGGIWAAGSTIQGNTIDGNQSGGSGGGVYADGCTVKNNIISNSSAGSGGGIYASGGTVADNVVSGNRAGSGGGIYGTGTIQGNTVTANSADNGGGIYISGGMAVANTVLNNTAYSSGGGLYVRGNGTASQNTTQDNAADHGGGIYSDSSTLNGNTAAANTAEINGGGIYAYQSTLQGNTITNNSAQGKGGGLYTEDVNYWDYSPVLNNTLSGNTVPAWGQGSGVYLVNAIRFEYNDVLTNTASGGTAGGISIEGQPQVHYNNIRGNQPYDAEIVSTGSVSATLNYWGPSACTAIAAQIYDGSDMPGRGQLLYAPSLYTAAPLTLLAAPADLTITVGISDAALSWTPILPLPDVGCRIPGSSKPDAGYRVSYRIGDACPPYDGKGADQGSSPVDVGQATSLTLSGLGEGAYYFVVTTYDYLGRESLFSNVVEKPSPGGSGSFEIYLPVVLRNS